MAEDALLAEVEQAADAALQAQASDEDVDGAQARALSAARAALDGGHTIAAIHAAQVAGEGAARERIGAQVLRSIERSGKKVRDATAEHERDIALGVRLGLATREIAACARLSHGTVTAVARRHEQAKAAPPPEAAGGGGEGVDVEAPAPESGAG